MFITECLCHFRLCMALTHQKNALTTYKTLATLEGAHEP
jgi:hypothetical protein